jgi:rubrerythrin
LRSRAGTAVGEAGTLEAIRKAFEIELGGMAFYAHASEETADPELKTLFKRFAAMEKEHMDTLARRHHVEPLAPGVVFRLDRAAMYAGVQHRPEDPASLFQVAIAFERRAVDFFSERELLCAKGSAERELYRELAAEEREHVDVLTTEYARWKRGKPGLL